jgi:hypothetical protein
VDETLSAIKGTVFSKLDANSGFLKIKLSEEFQLLTSFLTPFGRFCYTSVPFGISSGPEVYQGIIDENTKDLKNITGLVDDICVMSPDMESHEKYLFPVLQRLQDMGATLNIDKCEFMQDSITFVGHKITKNGISPDEKKVLAIKNMPVPTNVTELRRFLGMVNQLGKFSNQIADTTVSMKCLLKKNVSWHWGPDQEKDFQATKDILCSSCVLAAYSPQYETKIRSDASKYGYGAVLRYKFNIVHVPGKYMYDCDCLSRASIVDSQKSVLNE